jgi:type II secretory pathway pseudopilin PulG
MRKKSLRRRHVGAVLLIVMACLAVAMTLIVGWARVAVLENRQFRSAEDHLQAEWLAESAIQRAAAQLGANSEYPGETWRITAADFGSRPDAVPRAGTAAVPGVERATEKVPDAGAEPPAKDEPGAGEAGADEPILGQVLITVERVPNRAGARQVRVRADYRITQAAGNSTAVATNRISKQTIFDLSEPTAK